MWKWFLAVCSPSAGVQGLSKNKMLKNYSKAQCNREHSLVLEVIQKCKKQTELSDWKILKQGGMFVHTEVILQCQMQPEILKCVVMY